MTPELGTYLNALFGAEAPGGLIEIRYKRESGGMGQAWFGIREIDQAARAIRRLGAATDCYVGVLPRVERRGGADAIRHGHVLFVDCDAPGSIEALAKFAPAPSIIVSSGHGRHAYWALSDPIGRDWIVRANRRLAHALDADMCSTDAARILRPPETFNFKGDERRPVTVESLNCEVYAAADVVGELSDPPESRTEPCKPRRPTPSAPSADALLDIAPAEYVEALTGEQVGRSGLIRCPLPDHEDRTPSCQIYDDAERGWFCFGCERGGTIYDLASAMWSLDTRGEDFKILRRRISERLLNTPVAA